MNNERIEKLLMSWGLVLAVPTVQAFAWVTGPVLRPFFESFPKPIDQLPVVLFGVPFLLFCIAGGATAVGLSFVRFKAENRKTLLVRAILILIASEPIPMYHYWSARMGWFGATELDGGSAAILDFIATTNAELIIAVTVVLEVLLQISNHQARKRLKAAIQNKEATPL